MISKMLTAKFKSSQLEIIIKIWCLWSLQLSATMQLASGENFNLHLHLLHPIIPQQSNFKILTSKVQQSLLV